MNCGKDPAAAARSRAAGLRVAQGMHVRQLLFLSLVPLLCQSCVTPPPLLLPAAALEQHWQEHAAALASLSQWELRGRLAVQVDGRGGQATLSWSRDVARNTIRLNGPFGSGAVRIDQDASGARLLDAENREFEAGSAEALLHQYTGWRLPVAHLDWWVRGLPVPGVNASRELDAHGRLQVLRQQGWIIQYPQYIRIGYYELPQKLTLTYSADEAMPAMEARLVIDRWLQVK